MQGSGYEQLEVARFHHVVIHKTLVCLQYVVGIVKGGKHDHWDVLRLWVCLQIAYNLVAAHARQHDVANHEGWLDSPDVLVSRLTVHEGFHTEVDREFRLDLFHHVWVVFDNHHRHVVDRLRCHLLHHHVDFFLIHAAAIDGFCGYEIFWFKQILVGRQGKRKDASAQVV